MFRFYLNNTLVSDPINWGEFTETIERDETIKGLLPKYDVKLTFSAGGYKLLYDLKELSGFCTLVDLRIEEDYNGVYKTILEGYIFISDCKFNINKCIVDCSVLDNNFGARIYNNKNIKAFIGVARSKNDTAITATTYEQIELFTPTTGAYSATKRNGYLVSDAFRFLIDFMSDGLVGFESTYLTTNTSINSIKWLRIFTGANIRSASSLDSPYISFQQLFEEVNKKFPISFTIIKGSDGRPTMKIENDAYFFNATNGISISNIENMNISFNNEKLYSVIKFGGNSLDYNGSTTHFGQLRFFNFQSEEYHLKTECNLDRTLDLTANFIIDTNIIEEVFATNTSADTYDKDVFLIECTSTQLAQPYTDNAALPYYYNGILRNNAVAERYNLAGDIALYLGDNTDTFEAYISGANQYLLADTGSFTNVPTSTSWYSPDFAFNNDSSVTNCNSGFDTNNNYNITLFKYTSPANGYYGFEVYTDLDIVLKTFYNLGVINIRFNVYDSFNVLQNAYNSTALPSIDTGGMQLTLFNFKWLSNQTFYVASGYYVTVQLVFSAVDTNTSTFNAILIDWIKINGASSACPGTYLKTIFVQNGGGVYEKSEPGDYFIEKIEFENPISRDKYDTMKLDLAKSLTVNHDSITNRIGWLRKTVRKFKNGDTTFELISNINNS